MTVLIIPANYHWAQGYIAKGLLRHGVKHQIVSFMSQDMGRRQDSLKMILAKVDVIHTLCTFESISPEFRDVLTSGEVPLVASIYHIEPGGESQIPATASADVVHVISSETAELLEKSAGAPVILAPVGVDVSTIHPRQQHREQKLRIGTVGAFREWTDRKRWDVLVDVVRETGREHSVELHVQGSGWRTVASNLKSAGIKTICHDLKPMYAASNIYNHIDLYLCTSDIEGGPIPVLEAAAAGVPVISTRVGMSIDLLPDELLVNTGDVAGFVALIRRLATSSEYYGECSRRMCDVASGYAWPVCMDVYDRMYEAAVSNWEIRHSAVWIYRDMDGKDVLSWNQSERVYGLASEFSQFVRIGSWWVAAKVFLRLMLSAVSFKEALKALASRNYS